MEQEIWKPIPGYEGLYDVSNMGNVRSLDRYIFHKKYKKEVLYKGKNIAKNINPYGYLNVCLCNKNEKTFRVHVLVYKTFVGRIDDEFVINHIDGDKTNNKLLNLEAVSSRSNSAHFYNGNNSFSSKYVGVSWKKDFKKWCARIWIKGRDKHLGYYDTEKEAYEAYLQALKEYGIENKYAVKSQDNS